MYVKVKKTELRPVEVVEHVFVGDEEVRQMLGSLKVGGHTPDAFFIDAITRVLRGDNSDLYSAHTIHAISRLDQMVELIEAAKKMLEGS